jgi:hypothetical protein
MVELLLYFCEQVSRLPLINGVAAQFDLARTRSAYGVARRIARVDA